jgi:glycosyltransferase involved in cell wall biosynthesis
VGALAQLGYSRPIYWTTYYHGSLGDIEIANGSPYIYHCLDYFNSPEESALARGAILSLAVSATLVTKTAAVNRHTVHLPNGVALDWMPSRTDDLEAHRPSGRTLGFVGTINRHIDIELLDSVAATYSRHELLLVGPLLLPRGTPARATFARLCARPNVTWHGFQPPRDLPRFIARCDVCLIPFLQDAWMAHSDPIKLYQYLALGPPLTSSDR